MSCSTRELFRVLGALGLMWVLASANLFALTPLLHWFEVPQSLVCGWTLLTPLAGAIYPACVVHYWVRQDAQLGRK